MPGPSSDAPGSPPPPAVAAQASRASRLIWITVPGQAPRPAWHVWSEGASYVVHSGADGADGGQPIPGLVDASTVEVSVRGDRRGRVVTWRASVAHPDPGTERWEAAVGSLQAARRGELDLGGLVAGRAAGCLVAVLTPTGELVEEPGRYDDSVAGWSPARATATATHRPALG